ncbi:Spindle assembly checkpoint component MAD1, putative [Pediculus humanus corporis]|uniref:Spindle assembly checkpoint component MAD1, putative n=1 Tax=Pediculus humanus subsp. corporis TaxID=121224 RepID=E0VHU3_PEDHC|nr:Spindle assembly checkpoint component MAD1, putative [Pediculus humanus corporis]EEB12866.1 Spindle assembly checkpoint component MAD1, putative [Pediculus humanus corporis]
MQYHDENNLDVINQKITEIKKKIQLSEGQRKAHFEECDAEKKKNIDKIRTLKKDIREIYKKLSDPKTAKRICNDLILKTVNNPKEVGVIRNKNMDDAIDFMDLKCIDLNKQLDIFKLKNKMKKLELKQLAEEYRKLVDFKNGKKFGKFGNNDDKIISALENQIHRVEMNMMEAEHINKKYKTICLHLLSESVEFESTLKKLEDEIEKQNAEIQQLQLINKEAVGLRDATKGTLLRHEITALNAGKNRENQLQDFRRRVEERKLELERLERRIFPAGRVVFEEGTETGSGIQPNEVTNQLINQLESAFNKLKLATGETEAKDVLPRFISQKKTKERLEFLKMITEKEKKQLEMKKESCLAELESSKFSEVKDKEETEEKIEKLKIEINSVESLIENNSKEFNKMNEQLVKIGNFLYLIIQKVQFMNDELPPERSDNVENYINLIDCLSRKIQSGLGNVNLGENLRETVKNMEQNEVNDR